MNYYAAIWCLLSLTASIKATGSLGLGGLVYAPGHASADYYSYPRYAFEYAVRDPHTGDNKAQWEKRDGDVVRGAYSLVEPDGNIRIVEYWADDKSGFNAVVKRVGPNRHPTTVAAAPIYRAPIPVLPTAAIAAPISVGPVAHLGGLAAAPLVTGSLGHSGAAISTANLYKAAPIVVTAPIAPVHPAPIAPIAPVHPAPIAPIAPVNSAPIAPIAPVHSAPIAPVLPAPIIRPAPIVSPILTSPHLGSSLWNTLSAPIVSPHASLGVSAASLGEGLLRGSLGGYDNYGHLSSNLGYRH